jgi:choline dehydrogenase-like flavoprotein
MSALADLSAALLPPEAGGPDPDRVAAATRRLLGRMPAVQRAGVGVGLMALEGVALATGGRTLGRLDPDRRAALLERIGSCGPAAGAAIDGLKTLILMAAGAEAYAPEIAATGKLHAPSRPDPPLTLVPGTEIGEESTDAIVVGSGAGGAFAALELARAGLEVLIVEEGERWDSERIRCSHPLDRFASLYRDGGATAALGAPPIALPIGSAVGGTTVVNSGTCFRPPAAIAEIWRDGHGLDLAGNDLDERLTRVEEMIGVLRMPLDVIGRNGELALAGAKELGWEAAPLRRNAPGCRGACQCAIGCPNNAKSGVHLNALPAACEAGARIVTGMRVERLEHRGGRVSGIEAWRSDGSAVRLRAPRVVVAGGAVETPALLRRSGLGRHPRLGKNLSIHPALGATGRFAEPVVAWHGVLQSVGVEELHAERGILIEATSTPPGMGSMVIPGFGRDLVARIAASDHVATVGAMIADAPGGRVHGSRRPVVTYRLARQDRDRLIEALGANARVLFAAGAEEVELGGGAPPVRSERELGSALAAVDPKRLHLAAFHPTGTAAAGSDPARHPGDPDGALRGAQGVWVADASILPSCPGVNPQVSIMALAAGVGAAVAAAR